MSKKKVLLGVLASDASIDTASKRFFFYSKHEEYVSYIAEQLKQITNVVVNVRKVVKDGKYTGYRLWTNKNVYFNKLHEKFYPLGRKELNPWVIQRIDNESLAHIWMCDGYLEHSKNRKVGKVQNIGWFCLEAFPREELEILQMHLQTKFGILSTLVKKPWGFGYRIRVGGESLIKLISLVYPYILSPFKYKTILFYKRKENVIGLPNTEHFIEEYSEVEDIVRHPLKKGKT